MLVPAAMNIYSAQDALKQRDKAFVDDELKELRLSNASGTFEDGYLLGLETARAVLLGMPKLYQAGIKPEELV